MRLVVTIERDEAGMLVVEVPRHPGLCFPGEHGG